MSDRQHVNSGKQSTTVMSEKLLAALHFRQHVTDDVVNQHHVWSTKDYFLSSLQFAAVVFAVPIGC